MAAVATARSIVLWVGSVLVQLVASPFTVLVVGSRVLYKPVSLALYYSSIVVYQYQGPLTNIGRLIVLSSQFWSVLSRSSHTFLGPDTSVVPSCLRIPGLYPWVRSSYTGTSYLICFPNDVSSLSQLPLQVLVSCFLATDCTTWLCLAPYTGAVDLAVPILTYRAVVSIL